MLSGTPWKAIAVGGALWAVLGYLFMQVYEVRREIDQLRYEMRVFDAMTKPQPWEK